MITRPLDLAARLRPPPVSLEYVFFVNAGLIVVFFTLFGLRFVVTPGVSVEAVATPASDRQTVNPVEVAPGISVEAVASPAAAGLQIPQVTGAREGAVMRDYWISIDSRVMMDAKGMILAEALDERLRQAKDSLKKADPIVVIYADVAVPSGELARVIDRARRAGFQTHWAANSPEAAPK